MGAYFDSVVVPGDAGAQVRDLLVEWMGRRGFELCAAPPLFHYLDDLERAAIVGSSARGTVVLLSAPDETARLQWELKKLGKPSLQLWLVGSDVWGYTLVEDDAIAATFSSNRGYFGPGQGPGGDPRGDPERVAQAFGAPGLAGELARLQRRKRLFNEEVVEAFCAALGVRMAATSYAYALEGEAPGLDEVRLDRLLFARPRAEGISTIGGPLPRAQPRPKPVRPDAPPPGRSWQGRVIGALGGLAMLPFAIRMRLQARGRPVPPPRPWFRVEGARLVSDRYRCSIAVPAGAAASTGAPQGDAIAFEVGGARVSVQAVPRAQVRRLLSLPAEASVETDEPLAVGDLPARRLRSSEDGAVVERVLIEAPHAIYGLICRDAKEPAVAAALLEAARSFQAF